MVGGEGGICYGVGGLMVSSDGGGAIIFCEECGYRVVAVYNICHLCDCTYHIGCIGVGSGCMVRHCVSRIFVVKWVGYLLLWFVCSCIDVFNHVLSDGRFRVRGGSVMAGWVGVFWKLWCFQPWIGVGGYILGN